MAFKDNATAVTRLNDYNLRDLGGSASFEVQTISGRGLAPTRDRELQFPGEVGARNYGSFPAVRRIEVTGLLYANTQPDFRIGLDKLKELCRNRIKLNEVLYGEVEAQTLWFADEGVVHEGTAQAGATTTITLDTGASSTDDYYNDMEVEIIGGTGKGQVRKITDYTGSSRVATISPLFATTPDSTSQFWVRDNRYYLVNYSGTMNETRITNQWMRTGFSNVTLPFKAVMPFAVSDWKKQNIASVNGGDFQAIETGTAPSYPRYEIKGGGASSVNPAIIETTTAFQSNFNAAQGTGIYNTAITPSVSTGIKHQSGKLNQALELDTTLDHSPRVYGTASNVGDSFYIDNVLTRGFSYGTPDDCISDILNGNNGTISFWVKRSKGWGDLNNPNNQEMLFNQYLWSTSSIYITLELRYYTGVPHSPSRIYYNVGGTTTYVNTTDMEAGEWYRIVLRWDALRTGSGDMAGAYTRFEIYNSSGTLVQYTGLGSQPQTLSIDSAVNIGSFWYPSAGAATNHTSNFSGSFDDLAVWDRPLTDSERTALINGGTGVRADSIGSSDLIFYSDFDGTVGTDMTNPIASSNVDYAKTISTTTTAVTVNTGRHGRGNGDKIFKDNDRFVLYDQTGYKVQGFIDGTPTSTNVPIDNGSGGAVTDADKVGVYPDVGSVTDTRQFSGGTSSDLWVGTGDWTCSVWVKPSQITAYTVIVGTYSNLTPPVGNGWFMQQQDGGNLYFGFYWGYTSYNCEITENLVLNKWNHLCGTIDRSSATGVKLYLNGVEGTYAVQDDPTPRDTYDSTGGETFIAGTWNGTSGYWSGSLRDFRTYTTALSAADVLSLATNPLGAVGSPVNWWKMDDAASATVLANSGSGSVTLSLVNGTTTNFGTHSRTQQAYISKNLIADGGMENGGIGGWTFSNYTGMVSFGKTSASAGVFKDAQGFIVSGTGTDDELAVATAGDLATGEDYVIRCYCKVTTASTNVIYWYNQGAVWPVSGWEPYQTLPTDGEWHFIEFCAETGGTGPGRVMWARGGGSSVYYVDDVKLLPNLIDNGGLEGTYSSGVAPSWTGNTGSPPSTFAEETTTVHSGGSSQKITGGGTYGRIKQDVSIVAGNYYEVSGWAWESSSPASSSVPTIEVETAAPYEYFYAVGLASLTDQWQRVSRVFLAPTTGTYTFYFYGSYTATHVRYWDDISIVHRPDLSPTLTPMSTNYRYEPTRLGMGYHTGGNENMTYAITANKDEMAGRVVFRPQFPYTTGENGTVFIYGDSTDKIQLSYYNPEDKWYITKTAGGSSYFATSVAQNFSANDELEIGWYTDPSSGTQIFVNGSASGSTLSSNITALATNPATLWIGNSSTYSSQANMIIDDLEILTKSMPAEWFAEQYAKRLASKNQNLYLSYYGTLDTGDILTLDCASTKTVTRAELYDASAGTRTSAINNATIYGSKMPILSERKSMLYFPATISNGVDIHFKKSWQ